jgi:hypothetical protein
MALTVISARSAQRAHLGAGARNGPAVHRCDQHGYRWRRHKRELAKPRDELTTIVVRIVAPWVDYLFTGHVLTSHAASLTYSVA